MSEHELDQQCPWCGIGIGLAPCCGDDCRSSSCRGDHAAVRLMRTPLGSWERRPARYSAVWGCGSTRSA